jgi:hypothetical protein
MISGTCGGTQASQDTSSTNQPGLFACLQTAAGKAVLVLVNLTGAPIDDYRLLLPISALMGDPPGSGETRRMPRWVAPTT